MRTAADHTSEKPKRGQAIARIAGCINKVISMKFDLIALSEAIRELSGPLDRSLRRIAHGKFVE